VKEKRKKKAREAAARPLLTLAGLPLVAHLARSHWKALALAFVAVVGETLADVLEPWPIKIVVDNILHDKKLPPRFDAIVALFPQNPYATLDFALVAVLAIAVIGAVSSYGEKLLTTSVAQWVGHDLRRMVYQRIQRLSLAEHGESRTGDLLTRVTSDRRRPGFHHVGAAGDRHQPAHSWRHARRDVLHGLALHARRSLGRAGDVPGRLRLYEADQEGGAAGQEA
jgi:hypothetical protein